MIVLKACGAGATADEISRSIAAVRSTRRRPTACLRPSDAQEAVLRKRTRTLASTHAPSTTSRPTAPAPSSVTRSRPTRWAAWSAGPRTRTSLRLLGAVNPMWAPGVGRRPAAWRRWRLRSERQDPAVDQLQRAQPVSTSRRLHLKSPTRCPTGRYSGSDHRVSGFGFGGANAHLVLREVLPSISLSLRRNRRPRPKHSRRGRRRVRRRCADGRVRRVHRSG